MNVKTVFLGAALVAAAVTASAQDDNPLSLTDALTKGQTHLNLRYRYEFVDQDFNVVTGDPFTKNANASTVRVRLNHRTGTWQHWSGFGEFDYIGHVLVTDFNSGAGTSPGKEQYPVVADPKGADLNQLYFDYDGFSETKLRFGRQRITLDKHRFVGNVVWRQNTQTYDAVSGTFKGLPNTELFYAYVAQVNRIFGERSAAGTDDQNTHLLNARIKLADDWLLIPYGYYIDSRDFPAFSTSTFGARLEGSLEAGEGKIALVGEYASQTDVANAPVSFRASYAHFDLMWALKNGLSVGVGYESLGGDNTAGGKSFRTPLATLHAFQGWADQFLATPGAGIEDVNVTFKYGWNKWNLVARYHDLSAQSGSASWGNEFDFSVGRKFGERYGLLFKGAIFSADDASFSDVSKFWVMLTASY